MDAITLLRAQHQEVERAFAEYEGLGSAGDERKRELANQVVKDLSVHAAIEEQAFYPTVRDALPELEDEIKQDLEEHQEAKELLAKLDGLEPQDPEFDRTFREIISDVREHVEEEEGQLFPTVQRAFSGDDLQDLGETMETLAGLSPTRPHPNMPNEPPGNILTGPAAAAFDRVRDAARRLREGSGG